MTAFNVILAKKVSFNGIKNMGKKPTHRRNLAMDQGSKRLTKLSHKAALCLVVYVASVLLFSLFYPLDF